MVRQRGDRHVVTPSGVHVVVSDLVEHIRQRRAQQYLPTSIAFAKVKLSGHTKQLYIVASWPPGAEEPLILLTTMVVENARQAKHIVWYYRQRWVCEQAGQFLKSHVGLERFGIRRY